MIQSYVLNALTGGKPMPPPLWCAFKSYIVTTCLSRRARAAWISTAATVLGLHRTVLKSINYQPTDKKKKTFSNQLLFSNKLEKLFELIEPDLPKLTF